MPQLPVGPGVRVGFPEGMMVTPVAHGGSALAAAAPPQPTPLEESLLGAGFHVVADFRLTRSGAATPGLGAAAGPAPAVSVDVQAQEGAVVLMETGDGVFAWNFPQARHVQPAGLGFAAAAPGAATLVFSLAPPGAPGALAFGLNDLFSPVLHWVLGQVDGLRTRVLKFVVGKVEDFAIDKIEGADVTGMTSLAPANPALWKPGGAPIVAPAAAAAGAAPEVLLMVHGTFSNTTGSFGALTSTPEGRAFLAQAHTRYGAVWGYDHKTLAVGPDENASDMLIRLQPLLPHGAVVDAVAYSRGGLVYREFAERLLPQVRPDIVLRKAVFVGCTNGGTHLAEPKNWKALVDLYTNVAMAATRAITALAGAPLAGVIAGATLQLLGQFVQYLSVVAITDQRVPGLAGMEPEPGAIVHALNTAPIPASANAFYYAITSNFVAEVDLQKGITQDFKEMVIDAVTNRLFTDQNDLVVDTQFMTTLGLRDAELKPADVFSFGSGDHVCHLNYFAQAETAQRLSAWL